MPKRQISPARTRSKRGIVLVLTLFFMMILGLLSVALFAIVPQDLRQSLRYESDLQAHYAVTAGIKHATAFLSSAMNPAAPSLTNPMASTTNGWTPNANDPFSVPPGYDYQKGTCSDPSLSPWNMGPFQSAPLPAPIPAAPLSPDTTYFYGSMPWLRLNPNVIRLNGDWCVDVAVFPDKYTYPHADYIIAGQRSPAYTVVALAFHDYNGNGIMDGGNEHYVLRAKANMAVSSFARYAFFADKWDQNQYLTLQTQTAGSAANRALVDGPFHTNGYPQLYSQGGSNFWSQVPGATNTFTPMFTSSLTYSAAGGSNFATNANGPLNHDGIGWVGGNLASPSALAGTDASLRPYNDSNIGNALSYSRLIAGGESAIQSVPSISLPPSSSTLAQAAWGSTESSTIVAQKTIAAKDTIYVNSQAATPGNAAGGIYINGDVQQMVLQVINGAGVPVGDGTISSAIPSSTNDGNSAIRVTMATQQLATVGSTVSNYPTSTSTSGTFTQTNNVSHTYVASVTTGSNTVSYSTGVSTYPVTVNGSTGTIPYTGTSQSAPITYTVLGQGQGAGEVATLTSTSTVSFATQSTATGSEGTTQATATLSAGSTRPVPVSVSAASFLSTSQSPSYAATGQISTGTGTNTQFQTQKFQPVGVVIEANTSNMVLQASNTNLFNPLAASGASQSFILSPTQTVTSLQVNVSDSSVLVFNQDKANSNLWQVTRLHMPTNALNGAVQVAGNIGNTTNYSAGSAYSVTATGLGGISGWNKEAKTIAAEDDVWSSPSTVLSTVGKTLRIDGNTRVFGTTNGSQVSSAYIYKNNLGLLGSNIDVRVDGTASPFTTDHSMYIYAVMMASGSGLQASNLGGLYTNGQSSLMRLYGGLLQGNMGSVKEGSYGWNQEYNYDPENAIKAPPYFPTLADFAVYNYLEERLGSY